MKKKGFTLVELMVVVAIIAILAAVALPMYTRFKQKALASGPIKITGGTQAAFQAYFDNIGDFLAVNLRADTAGNGMQIWGVDDTGADAHLGTNLAGLKDVTWLPEVVTATRVTLSWTWAGNKCPSVLCDGSYCIECIPTSDLNNTGCDYAVTLADTQLSLNKASNENRLAGC